MGMQVPYPMTAAMTLEQRYAQMQFSIGLGLPRLTQVPIDETSGRSLTIAAYGPSLEQTWQDLQHPILSMSGATRWLAERGVIADYHIDMDPRPHKLASVDPPVPGVHYLIASLCCPAMFAKLKNEQVTLWHVYSGRDPVTGRDTYDWVAEHDHGELVIHGGSTIGLTAFHIGGVLGYRHFEVHGMDGSFADTTRQRRHAGPHTGTKQNKDGITWDAGGVTYPTSKIMANAVTETLNTLKNYPIFAVFHGQGLTQALVREANLSSACCVDETEKAMRVQNSRARFMSMPQVSSKAGVRSLWDALLAQSDTGTWLSDVLTIAREAEPRRAKAKYNTGTVPVETALLLRALTAWAKPKVAVEIGTFIGTSALALQAEHVFTCDRDNDCLADDGRVHPRPYTTSTALLRELVDRGVSVDFFFLDGRLQPGDCALVEKLAHPGTIYALDDYNGLEKGVINAGKLLTQLPNHVLVEPYQPFEGRTTLAALVPVGQT